MGLFVVKSTLQLLGIDGMEEEIIVTLLLKGLADFCSAHSIYGMLSSVTGHGHWNY